MYQIVEKVKKILDLIFFLSLKTFNMQIATCNFQNTICNMQFATCILQLAICNMQFATCNLQCAICMMQFSWCNLHDAIWMMQYAWCNLDDAIFMMKFAVCVSSHSSGSLEGCCPFSAEVIEDTEDFVYYSGFYSLFSEPTDLLLMFERFLYVFFQRFPK